MNRFDADAKFRRAVALEQVEKPAPSQRVKSYSHTSQYEHSSDVGFVTSTSDHFAAGVTIEELLDVSRDAAAVTVWALSGVIGLLLQVFLLAVVVVVVVLGGCLSAPRGIRGCSVITAAGAAIVSCGTIVGHSISVLLVPVHGLEEGHASRDGARHGAQDPGCDCPGLWLCPVLGCLRRARVKASRARRPVLVLPRKRRPDSLFLCGCGTPPFVFVQMHVIKCKCASFIVSGLCVGVAVVAVDVATPKRAAPTTAHWHSRHS